MKTMTIEARKPHTLQPFRMVTINIDAIAHWEIEQGQMTITTMDGAEFVLSDSAKEFVLEHGYEE